jgi:hypothetical protein
VTSSGNSRTGPDFTDLNIPNCFEAAPPPNDEFSIPKLKLIKVSAD